MAIAGEFWVTLPSLAFITPPELAEQSGFALKLFDNVPPFAPIVSPDHVSVWLGLVASVPPPALVTVYPAGKVTTKVASVTTLVSGLVI